MYGFLGYFQLNFRVIVQLLLSLCYADAFTALQLRFLVIILKLFQVLEHKLRPDILQQNDFGARRIVFEKMFYGFMKHKMLRSTDLGYLK